MSIQKVWFTFSTHTLYSGIFYMTMVSKCVKHMFVPHLDLNFCTMTCRVFLNICFLHLFLV